MHYIEHYPDGKDATAEIGGRTYPVPALVEDDDGIRLLLVHSDDDGSLAVPVRTWTQAHAAGAAAIVDARADCWMLAEVFIETRAEHPASASYITRGGGWGPLDASQPISYRQMRQWLRRGAVADPDDSVESASRFVHLHAHSEYSPLDGLSKVEEMVAEAVKHGQSALAVTDHGRCAAHPALQIAADKAGIKPIFGIEANFTDDRHKRGTPKPKDGEEVPVQDTAAYVLGDYSHLVMWAMDDAGLRNLWAMSTEANLTGSYGRPRMDWEVLETYAEGVMASTACLRGPVARPLLAGDETAARAVLARLMDIFPGRLYVEIHTNQLPETLRLNEQLVALAREYDLPLIASVDSHYPCREDAETHQVWVAAQTDKTLTDDADLFAGEQDYHLMGEAEVRQALAYLGPDVVEECIANTAAVADRCTARIEGKDEHPVYSKVGANGDTSRPARVQRDVERLVDLCLSAWEAKVVGKDRPEDEYAARFEREMRLLIDKEFCGYFLMVADYCLDPSTPVLTEDMRWVEIGKVAPGDRLAGFDEHLTVKDGNRWGHRYWRGAEVLSARRIVLPTYRVTLEDGTVTIASEDHQWLASRGDDPRPQWVRTKDLAEFARDKRFADGRSVAVRMRRLTHEWDAPEAWEAGYIAGILDGEGSLSLTSLANGGRSLSLGFAQREGAVLDRALSILEAWGFDYSVGDHGGERNGLRSVWIRGGRAEVMRLLGMARPERLLAKLDLDQLGRTQAIAAPAVVSIEFLGPREVVALETSTHTLVAQGFAHHNCAAAKDGRVMQAYDGTSDSIIVGPGRGSGGGSLVAYLSGITDLDPVDADLLFERFLTEGRVGLPDFDVDFPESKRPALMAYLAAKYGEDHILRVGTHVRLQNKGTVKDMAKVLKSTIDIHYPDIEAVSKIIDAAEADKAGLGMSWEDLWDQHDEVLSPYREKYPLLFKHADRIVGRLKTYGKHPAGVIIATDEPLTGRLPMRRAGDQMVAEFDLESLEALGYVKFDLLTLRTLDSIQEAADLVRSTHGISVDPYTWREEYEDPQVWEEISDGHTLGIFQIETASGTRLTRRFRPQSLNELADVITLVRPGPMRSGLTETYFRRKAGLEPVTFPDPRLEQVLAKTYGTMLYQEDIMAVTMILAGYDPNQADAVRKILGKKQVEKVAQAGREFVAAAVERGMDREAAEHLWEQMAEFAKYSFNRAHAYGYAVLGYWTAWLKFHYPAQYLNSLMTTVDKGRIPEFVTEARRMGYKVLPPDINLSGAGFSAHGVEIRYGLDKVKGIGEAAVRAITQGQPYTSFADFMERKGSEANSGVVKLLAAVGAFDSLEPNRKVLEARLVYDAEESGRCVFKDESHLGPGGLPCTFDWANEPDPPLVRVGRGKDKTWAPKPPPKRCTRACRNFTAPVFQPEAMVPYTDAEIREKEMALLGIHLSSTPFDIIPEEILADECYTHDEVETGPEGEYLVAATVSRIKPHTTRYGKPMAFLTLMARTGDLDATVFTTEWERFKPVLRPGMLCFAFLRKNDRGINLIDLQPLD